MAIGPIAAAGYAVEIPLYLAGLYNQARTEDARVDRIVRLRTSI